MALLVPPEARETCVPATCAPLFEDVPSASSVCRPAPMRGLVTAPVPLQPLEETVVIQSPVMSPVSNMVEDSMLHMTLNSMRKLVMVLMTTKTPPRRLPTAAEAVLGVVIGVVLGATGVVGRAGPVKMAGTVKLVRTRVHFALFYTQIA